MLAKLKLVPEYFVAHATLVRAPHLRRIGGSGS
jgi:hypothetical protein